MKKAIVGLGVAMLAGGCSSAPLDGSESESVTSVQEEVALNAEASEQLRLITRLYIEDYAALEWYQPRAGLIAFSVVQPGGIDAIDGDSLRGLKPSEVFKKFARSLDVPDALLKLEAHPEVLQELQSREAVERFAPEVDLKHPGVMPQGYFTTSRSHSPYTCASVDKFKSQVCNGWDFRDCHYNKFAWVGAGFEDVEESQTSVCSVRGINQMHIWITGCENGVQPEPENVCDGQAIPWTGVWLDVSPGYLRSWHAHASSAFGIEDAYTHWGEGQRKPGQTGSFHLATRVFWD